MRICKDIIFSAAAQPGSPKGEEPADRWKNRGELGRASAFPNSGCQKPHGELERAEALSNFQSYPAACTAGAGRFYRREILFPGEKIATLQILRPGILKES